MLAYTLKEILDLVPEALPLVKQASVDQEMPIDSRDSTIASALQLQYLEKLAYHPVDVFEIDKVASAVKLYGVEDQVKELANSMVKAAHQRKIKAEENSVENYLLKVSNFEGTKHEMAPEKRSEIATSLYKEAKDKNLEPSEDVLLYSGNAWLSKEAAVKALSVRYDKTKNQDFVKIAVALSKADKSPEIVTAIANTIEGMDKVAGLHFTGHNFYKEAFFTKEAAYKGSVTVRLAGKDVPYESLERVGKANISRYVGEDVAKEMDAGPDNFKTVVETLPLDLQRILVSLIKNV